jgi:hypothetical protein
MAISYFPTNKTPYGSWQDVGLWYGQLAGPSRRSSPEIEGKVAELTASKPVTMDKVRALAAFVQREVRYVAIEIGIGGYQPHGAASIFSNRYGDCKDKATLLATMLQQIGVNSYYVLTHSARGVIAPEFPSAMNFNHVVLAIQLPQEAKNLGLPAQRNHPKLGPLLFFDPTDEFTPLGFLPAPEQANRGLLVTQDGGELVELPSPPAAMNLLRRSAKLKLDQFGRLSGEVQEVRSGYPAAEYRFRLLRASPREREKTVESFLGRFLNGVQVAHLAIDHLDEIDKELVLSYAFTADQYGKTAGNLLLLRPAVVGEKSSDILEGGPRKEPFEFPALSLFTDEFEWTLPSGYHLDGLPKPLRASFPFAEYQSAVQTHENVILYTRSYEVKDVRVRTEDLPDLKKFFRQIAAEERDMVVLKH